MEFNLVANFLDFIRSNVITFAAAKSAAVAGVVAPAFYVCMGIYVAFMGWGYISGKTEEPMMEFTKRVAKLGFIGNLALGSAMYSEYIINTFWNSPEAIAGALSGTNGNIGQQLDAMMNAGGKVSWEIWQMADTFDFGLIVMSLIIMFLTLAVVAYGTFLIAMSKIFTGVLLAVGSMFIISLLFNATQKFFETWIAQLANYGLVQVFTVGVNVFILDAFQRRLMEFQSFAPDDRTLFNCIPLLLMAAISLLTLPQITALAAGVAGGISLSSMGMGRLAMAKMTGGASELMRAGSRATNLDRMNPVKKMEERKSARDRVQQHRREEEYRAKTHGQTLAAQRRNDSMRQAANRRFAEKNPMGNIKKTGT